MTGTPNQRSLVRRLFKDRRGTTMVEFALVAAPFLALLAAIFEVAYVHLENELLSGAVAKAARAMLTGKVQSNAAVTNAATFVNTYLCPSTGTRIIPSNFDCSKLIVDIRPASSFASANVSNDFYKGGAEFCPTGAGGIMVMRVAYPLPAIFPLNLFSKSVGTVSDVPGTTGSFHLLLGSALFRNESFSASYTPPTGC